MWYTYSTAGKYTGVVGGSSQPPNSTSVAPPQYNPSTHDLMWSGGNWYTMPKGNPTSGTQLSEYQFKKRLTPTEYFAIYHSTDPMVFYFCGLLDSIVDYVDLVDPFVGQALGYLTTTTPQLLTPERVAEILTP